MVGNRPKNIQRTGEVMLEEAFKVGTISCASYFPPDLVYWLMAANFALGIVVGVVMPHLGQKFVERYLRKQEPE